MRRRDAHTPPTSSTSRQPSSTAKEAITITRAGQPEELLKPSDADAARKNLTFDVPEQGYADVQTLGRISRKGRSPVIINAVSAAKAGTQVEDKKAVIVKDAHEGHSL